MPPKALVRQLAPRPTRQHTHAAASTGRGIYPLVLAVDPQPGMQRLIKQEMSIHGFRVIVADSAADCLRRAEQQRPDIVLIEEGLPDMCGLELMRVLRQRSTVPIIFVTGSGTQVEKVRALELGADDYLEKPFDPPELGSRIRAVLRRTMGPQALERTVAFDGIEIDLNRRVVTRDGQMVDLTRSEWLLLEHLAANADRVMLNEELLTKVWGPEYQGDVPYLRVWISRLRHKLEPRTHRSIIRTVKGMGYMLHTAPERAAVAC